MKQIILFIIFTLLIFGQRKDQYSNANIYLTRYGLSATGSASSNTNAINRALAVFGNGTLIVPKGIYNINSVTIPDSITLQFERGGILKLQTGDSLVINGDIQSGLYQIFDTTSRVKLDNAKLPEIYPEWWGAKADRVTRSDIAISKAINSLYTGYSGWRGDGSDMTGGTVRLSPGTYRCENTITVSATHFHDYAQTTSMSIIGAGMQSTTFDFANAPANADGLYFTDGNYTKLESFRIDHSKGNGLTFKGTSTVGWSQACNFHLSLRNFGVWRSAKTGILLDNCFMIDMERVESRHNGEWGIRTVTSTTSLAAVSCWAASNAKDGWSLNNCGYSSLTSCGADGNSGYGYFINASQITLNSCGAEANGKTPFYIFGSSGVTLNSCSTFANNTSGFTSDSTAASFALIGNLEDIDTKLYVCINGSTAYETSDAELVHKSLYVIGNGTVVSDNNNRLGTAGVNKVTASGGIITTLVRLPTYANNAAAIAGGLTVGSTYKTPAGVVMVVYKLSIE